MSIQQWEDRAAVALSTSQDVAVQRLGEWAQSADAAHRIATTLVQTSFCPEAFRNKAGEATAAILAGIEVGLQPMAALRAFDVIQGQAAPRAITLRAVVQSHGHELEVVESTASRCVMRGRRRGSSEWQKVVWTIDRAKQLGVTNKPNWKNQPQTMLVARATSELARLVASDAILGLPYSIEELADGGGEQTDTTTPAAPTGTRKMKRPVPETSDPDPVTVHTAEAPVPPTSGEAESSGSEPRDTEGQMKAMHASFNEAGITERQDRLDFAMSVVNREIESSNDLTWDERHDVIEALKALPRDAEVVS